MANYCLDYLVPRCIGLRSLHYDFDEEKFVPSRLWLTVCNLCGLFFIVVYPFAAIELVKFRPLRETEDNSVGRIIVVSHYIFLYLLSVAVFLRQMWLSKHQMQSINRYIHFYRQCEKLGDERMDVAEYIYPFIFRGIYSYFGYIFVNYLVLEYMYDDLSHVNVIYIFLYFVPNVVIITTLIRFHSGMMQLTVCGRRLNREFSRCIESINAVHLKSTAEFQQVCMSAMRRFEYLTSFHGEWYEIARIIEKDLSPVMIFTVINSFFNLTQSVR